MAIEWFTCWVRVFDMIRSSDDAPLTKYQLGCNNNYQMTDNNLGMK